jgi:hypothetical protein
VPANETDADSDGYRICENDCDDTNGSVNPGAAEVCNNVDDNCNGDIDEDDFSGTNGDPPNSARWSVSETSNATVEIQSNTLSQTITNSGNAEDGSVVSNWFLTGDFDARVDFDLYDWPTGSSYGATANFGIVNVGNGWWYDIARSYDNVGNRIKAREGDPTYALKKNESLNALTGKFRMVRVGSSLTAYYKTSGDWVNFYTWPNFGTQDCKIFIGLRDNLCDEDVTVRYDNCNTNDGVLRLTFYLDSDNDGFGDPEQTIQACTVPAGYVPGLHSSCWVCIRQ